METVLSYVVGQPKEYIGNKAQKKINFKVIEEELIDSIDWSKQRSAFDNVKYFASIAFCNRIQLLNT